MAKIPFNIKYRPQIEAGEYKVEIGQSDPWPARIVCWDLNGNDLITIVTNPDGKEEGLIYTPEGKHKAYAPRIDSDLFLVLPDPEMTEWEMAIARALTDAELIPRDKDGFANIHDIDEFIKKKAAELLAIARKELEPEVLERLEEAYKNQDDVVYEIGKRDGKAEALKDLPRWKKAAQAFGNYTVAPTETGEYCLLIDGRFIMLSELMKLPGFKEDKE